MFSTSCLTSPAAVANISGRRCNCSISSRVLPAEVAFLRDQKGARQMAIGGRDYVETSRRRSAAMRRQKRERLEGRDATDQPGPSSVATSLSIDTDLADEGDSSALDTSDSSKPDGSESAMLEDIQGPILPRWGRRHVPTMSPLYVPMAPFHRTSGDGCRWRPVSFRRIVSSISRWTGRVVTKAMHYGSGAWISTT